MGIDELTLSAGKFNTFAGKNGTGKTSALEALKTVFGNGHDTTVIKDGIGQAVVELTTDDNLTLSAKISQSGTTRDIRDQNGIKQKEPSKKIKSLIDSLSINPVSFLSAEKKDRVKILLESMPLKASAEKISSIIGKPFAETEAHALTVIDSVRKIIYDERTATNGAIKSLTNHVNQLANTIPESLGEIDLDKEALLNQRESVENKQFEMIAKIDNQINKERKAKQEEIGAIDLEIVDLQNKIANIQKKKAEILESMRSREFAATQAKTKQNEIATAEKAKIDADIRLIDANQDQITRVTKTREDILKASVDISDLEKTAEKQNKQITDLDNYKIELLSKLPVAGLEIVDGDIMFNSVNFDRVNEAEKVKIAVQIAKLRAGNLKIICVDGIEKLDQEAFELFKAEMLKTDLQLFTTRAQVGEFKHEVD